MNNCVVMFILAMISFVLMILLVVSAFRLRRKASSCCLYLRIGRFYLFASLIVLNLSVFVQNTIDFSKLDVVKD